MHKFSRIIVRNIGAAAIGSLMMVGAMAAPAAAADAPRDQYADRAQHRQEWIAGRLDEMASRLEIKASQQDAWQAYSKAVKTLGERRAPPPADADAATLTRARADAFAAMAKKLDQVADATSKLQAVLSPEQRTTLDQIVRHAGHGWKHGHDGGFGERAGHGHPGMGDHCDHFDGHGAPDGGPARMH
jgi:hypothetical protein